MLPVLCASFMCGCFVLEQNEAMKSAEKVPRKSWTFILESKYGKGKEIWLSYGMHSTFTNDRLVTVLFFQSGTKFASVGYYLNLWLVQDLVYSLQVPYSFKKMADFQLLELSDKQ